jgi:hypothetical protein
VGQVRVVDHRGAASLEEEQLGHSRIGGQVRQQSLHHQLLLEAVRADPPRQVDLGSRTLTETPDQLVLTERDPRHGAIVLPRRG